MLKKFNEKQWYKDMISQVYLYLQCHDYDTDITIQVIENSPYISSGLMGYHLLNEIEKDISKSDIIDIAKSYGYDEDDNDDTVLCNAIYMKVAEEFLTEYESHMKQYENNKEV